MGSVCSTAALELLKKTCEPPTLPSETKCPPWNSATAASLQLFHATSPLTALSHVGVGPPKNTSGASAHGTVVPLPRPKLVPPAHMTSVTFPGSVSVALTTFLLSLIHISEPTRLLSISYAVFCLK